MDLGRCYNRLSYGVFSLVLATVLCASIQGRFRPVTMPRYFTLQQAENILPGVAAAIDEAIALKQKYQRMESERDSLAQRVAIVGGARVDRASVIENNRSRAEAAITLRECVEKIQGFGCLVKDLDIGLIDFPTLYREREVYLCWRRGESSIEFWHGVDEGFRGRKPIDAGFLAQHRGETLD